MRRRSCQGESERGQVPTGRGRSGANARAALRLAAVNRVPAEQLLDAEELVVLRDAVGAAERTGLDLAGVGCHGDVRDGCVFGLTGAMADHGRVPVFLREFNGVERLGERADLVDTIHLAKENRYTAVISHRS